MSDGWRCFVAVPLPDALRASLATAVDAWRADTDGPDLRWTAPDGWHLTLAFLGAVDRSIVPALRDAIAATSERHPAWITSAGGVGAFPTARRARVVWYGVGDEEGRLALLARELRAGLEPLVPTLRGQAPFRAHVTLARARPPRGVDLTTWLVLRRPPDGLLAVDRVVLFRSHLGRGPARYEALGMATLGAPAVG